MDLLRAFQSSRDGQVSLWGEVLQCGVDTGAVMMERGRERALSSSWRMLYSRISLSPVKLDAFAAQTHRRKHRWNNLTRFVLE